MAEDSVSCGKCKHCFVVAVPNGPSMLCPYWGIVGDFVKECKEYEPKEEDNDNG